MGDLDTVSVVLFITGGLLIFGAIKNRNPISIIKNVLAGKGPDAVQSADFLAAQNIITIPGTPNKDPSEFHSDGSPKLYPNGTPRFVDDPPIDSLPQNSPLRVFKSVPAPGAPGDPRPPKDAKRPGGPLKVGVTV
jgi:hypothetical protein